MLTYRLNNCDTELEQAINLLLKCGIAIEKNNVSSNSIIGSQTNGVGSLYRRSSGYVRSVPRLSARIPASGRKLHARLIPQPQVIEFKKRAIIVDFRKIKDVLKEPDLYADLIFGTIASIENIGFGVALAVVQALYKVLSSCVKTISKKEFYVLLLINENGSKGTTKDEIIKKINEKVPNSGIDLEEIISTLKNQSLIESIDVNKYKCHSNLKILKEENRIKINKNRKK